MDNNKDLLKVEFQVAVTGQDIDDIMCGALEGGITYWCDSTAVVGGTYLGEYASEQISRGGQLALHDCEDDQEHILTKEMFLEGLKKYLENPHPYDITEATKEGLKLDTCQADAEVCDMIIQYAIFGDVIYG